MISMRKELVRLSYTLTWRGAIMLVLGAAAALWPETMLIPALLVVGGVATLTGIYEITVGISLRGRTPRWPMVVAHGTGAVFFGLITEGVTAVRLELALWVIAASFVAWSVLAVYAARLVTGRGARSVLFTWATFNLVIAIASLVYAGVTIFAVLFLGAVYAALCGALELSAGLWLRSSFTTLALSQRANRRSLEHAVGHRL